jgi:two-component system sensor histidine kinase BaeS
LTKVFLDYINGLEQERLQYLSNELLALYAANPVSQTDPSVMTEQQSTRVWQSINQKALTQAIALHAPRPQKYRPDGSAMPPKTDW